MDSVSQQTFEYQNKLRMNPKIGIEPLKEKLKYFKGNVMTLPGSNCGLMTNEGPAAIQECIKFLEKQQPLPALKWSVGLSKAAQDHVNDCGPSGLTGHVGNDKSTMKDRLERYGSWMGNIGENISYGQNSGQEVILQLIVDDGVPSRGHRTNVFKPEFNIVGIGSGNHKTYKTSCVLDYASEYTEGKQNKQIQPVQTQECNYENITKLTFEYQNKLRMNPKIGIEPLKEKLKYFKGNVMTLPGSNCGLMTNEGPAAIQGFLLFFDITFKECIKFLEKQQPLPALKWSVGLSKAAQDHVNDCGPSGLTGHVGNDNSTMKDRLERYGSWMGNIGENISYGQNSGQEVILQLIVDDGVPSRGHRTNVFKPEFNIVGIGSGNHKTYKTSCVLDYASEYTEGKQNTKIINKEIQQQPQQQREQQQAPQGCVSTSTQTKTTISNGKKTTVVVTTYKMANGSTQVNTTTSVEEI